MTGWGSLTRIDSRPASAGPRGPASDDSDSSTAVAWRAMTRVLGGGGGGRPAARPSAASLRPQAPSSVAIDERSTLTRRSMEYRNAEFKCCNKSMGGRPYRTVRRQTRPPQAPCVMKDTELEKLQNCLQFLSSRTDEAPSGPVTPCTVANGHGAWRRGGGPPSAAAEAEGRSELLSAAAGMSAAQPAQCMREGQRRRGAGPRALRGALAAVYRI